MCVVSFSLLFLYHEWTGCERETLPQVAALDANVVCTASVDLSALCQHPLRSPLLHQLLAVSIYAAHLRALDTFTIDLYMQFFVDFLAAFQLTF